MMNDNAFTAGNCNIWLLKNFVVEPVPTCSTASLPNMSLLIINSWAGRSLVSGVALQLSEPAQIAVTFVAKSISCLPRQITGFR